MYMHILNHLEFAYSQKDNLFCICCHFNFQFLDLLNILHSNVYWGIDVTVAHRISKELAVNLCRLNLIHHFYYIHTFTHVYTLLFQIN